MEQKSSKPLCAIVIARHGARTPSTIPKSEESFWRDQLSGFDRHEKIQSQLTLQGESDMKELGKKLYKSYSHLIGYQVVKNTRFYSTDYDRTKQSAHLVAFEFGADPNAVIFREGKADPLDPWVSIPEFPLKVAQFEKNNPVHLEELKRVDSLKSQLIGEFKDHFSAREFTWIDAYDICFCASNHASSPHHDSASRLINQVTETVTRQFNYLYSLSDIRKLAAGGLFGGLYNWFSTKSMKHLSNNQVQLKENSHYVDLDGSPNFVFVCCHDVNLLPLMMGINWSEHELSDIAWPGYGFHLAFELMEDLHVRIRDSTGKEKRIPLEDFLILCDKESL